MRIEYKLLLQLFLNGLWMGVILKNRRIRWIRRIVVVFESMVDVSGFESTVYTEDTADTADTANTVVFQKIKQHVVYCMRLISNRWQIRVEFEWIEDVEFEWIEGMVDTVNMVVFQNNEQ